MKVARRLRTTLLPLAALIVVSLWLLQVTAPHPPLSAPYSPATSTLDCHGNTRSCLLRNVHADNGVLKLYIGASSQLNCTDLGLGDALQMFTGIGWGTGYVRFVCGEPGENNRDVWKGDSLLSLSASGRNSTDPKRFALPVHVINKDPPPSYSKVVVVSEPTILFSVLWPNLFRTIYASYAAWYSLLEYKIFFPEHHRVLLVDRTPHPYKFLSIIQAVTPTPILTANQLLEGTFVFKALVVGLSRDALVAEIVLERGSEWRFALRRKAFHMFCNALKQGILHGGKFVHGLSPSAGGHSMNPSLDHTPTMPTKKTWLSYLTTRKKPRLTLIFREPNTPRQILNENQIISALKHLPITLSVHRFHAGMTLLDQVRIIDATDILITMHGAAMTHLLFLKPNAYVIELFPYAFKKVIYQNIASILNVRYLHWQNMRESRTRFDWGVVERNRVTDMTKERIIRLPIDWYNMDSKNYWRNQDTEVGVEELTYLVKSVVKDRANEGQTKYLLFMPWEQFNNQVVGFKSACAVANMLGRTLVLPHLGYKNPNPTTSSPTAPPASPEFTVTNVIWHPFEYYFDLTNLSTTLPCEFITFDNFYSLNQGAKLPAIRYHHLGDNKTSERQLRDYYNLIARLPFNKLEYDNAYFHLPAKEIMNLHAKDATPVLALGSMFWYFDFGVPVKYPLHGYHDYMENALYRRISESLVPTERVQSRVEAALKTAGLGDGFVAIHVRRGDYESKCRELPEGVLQDRCFTRLDFISDALRAKFSENVRRKSVLYISTNAGESEVREMVNTFGNSWGRVMVHGDLKEKPVEGIREDGIDECLFDQLVCARSVHFVGNMYSSFTRHVIDMRRIRRLESSLF
ncbi:Protein O-linked-mannose beta-1,4-N-acetylglucosaminyltransferase 2 [Rhizoclosmatium sp. JEL0117]|nr:Protein O-linked-mannose beta-1,4-N-acetylglucosaminyltransferase 2 [Rhizoclosmatium sp. JEL0117]